MYTEICDKLHKQFPLYSFVITRRVSFNNSWIEVEAFNQLGEHVGEFSMDEYKDIYLLACEWMRDIIPDLSLPDPLPFDELPKSGHKLYGIPIENEDELRAFFDNHPELKIMPREITDEEAQAFASEYKEQMRGVPIVWRSK